jgi:hypothetical protein
MDAATVFAIGIGVFAAMDLTFRLAEGLSRLAENVPWLALRAGSYAGARDDFYVFFHIRDLTGEGKRAPASRQRPAAGAPRPRPRLSQSC